MKSPLQAAPAMRGQTRATHTGAVGQQGCNLIECVGLSIACAVACIDTFGAACVACLGSSYNTCKDCFR
jgi:hypothetical protein